MYDADEGTRHMRQRFISESQPPQTAPYEQSGITHISKRDGLQLLDRQARKYLGMSGEDFRRQYRAGTIEDPERSEVIRVSLLLPLADD